ncbi:MAG: hypothetical protein V3V08_19675 [Nannocystaceae bacterium]
MKMIATSVAAIGTRGEGILVSMHSETAQSTLRLPERRVAWVRLTTNEVGTYRVSSETADLLYWSYAASNRQLDPDVWVHEGELSGEVRVDDAAYSSGESVCGTFNLTLTGTRQIRLVGSFRHVFDGTAQIEDTDIS